MPELREESYRGSAVAECKQAILAKMSLFSGQCLMFFSNVFAELLKAVFNLCSICNLICIMLLPRGASAVNGTGWLCLCTRGGWTRSPCPGLLCQGNLETSLNQRKTSLN